MKNGGKNKSFAFIFLFSVITNKFHCKFCLLTQYVAGCNLKRYPVLFNLLCKTVVHLRCKMFQHGDGNFHLDFDTSQGSSFKWLWRALKHPFSLHCSFHSFK